MIFINKQFHWQNSRHEKCHEHANIVQRRFSLNGEEQAWTELGHDQHWLGLIYLGGMTSTVGCRFWLFQVVGPTTYFVKML